MATSKVSTAKQQILLENWKLFTLFLIFSITDAASTSYAYSLHSLTELSPFGATLLTQSSFLTSTILLSLITFPILYLILHLCTSPKTNSTGKHLLTAIIIAKALATTNNILLHLSLQNQITYTAAQQTILLGITYGAYISITGRGLHKDYRKYRERKSLETLPSLSRTP